MWLTQSYLLLIIFINHVINYMLTFTWNQLTLEWKFRDISCIKVLQWNQCPLDASTTKSSKRIQSHSFHSKYARGRFSQDSNLQASSQGLGLTILLVVPFVLYIWAWALSSAFNHLVAQTQSTLGWMSFVSIYLGRQACGGPYLSLFGQNMDTFKAQFPTPGCDPAQWKL